MAVLYCPRIAQQQHTHTHTLWPLMLAGLQWAASLLSLLPVQVGLEEQDPSELTYRSLLGKLMEQMSQPLVDAYGAIEKLLGEVEAYVTVSDAGSGAGSYREG